MSRKSWDFDPSDNAYHLIQSIIQRTGVNGFDLAVILGSGWHQAASLGETLATFTYSDWDCFPSDMIPGHGGKLVAVRISSLNVLFFCGRFHCYQGLSAFQAAFPVRLASALGCNKILMTCATGGVNPDYCPGDIMVVEDHLNFLGENPLKGIEPDQFVDMSGAYQCDYYDQLVEKMSGHLSIHRGVLAAMSGPSYETPAEIRFLSIAGADVVSMSVVHESIMARYLNMHVSALAFVANYAAGIKDETLSHQDVLKCTQQYAQLFPVLISCVLDLWCQENLTRNSIC